MSERHTPALEARRVSATLGATEVLHDIDLALSAARWTSIVGPNGAGKSTLLKALAGLLAHRGEVRLFGEPQGKVPARIRAQRLSWLGQSGTGEGSAD
ncbi:ATP-binding cassette domain-containing protein, partial [Variovorax sp. Varisp62]|uniref:ATP-binding cassette domain-containing protein n=1 Tax=Variovorax sp. Varisp62 TaxID=3243049 RepID=UPI0039B60E53